MDNKLKALARNISRELGSVFSFGGGPGTVGRARIPKSFFVFECSLCTKKTEIRTGKMHHISSNSFYDPSETTIIIIL